MNQPTKYLRHALTCVGVKFDPRYFLTFSFYVLHRVLSSFLRQIFTARLSLKSSVFPLLLEAEMTCEQIMAKVCRSVTSMFLRLGRWNFAWWLYIYVSQVGYIKNIDNNRRACFPRWRLNQPTPGGIGFREHNDQYVICRYVSWIGEDKLIRNLFLFFLSELYSKFWEIFYKLL